LVPVPKALGVVVAPVFPKPLGVVPNAPVVPLPKVPVVPKAPVPVGLAPKSPPVLVLVVPNALG